MAEVTKMGALTRVRASLLALALCLPGTLAAQEAPFRGGWVLQSQGSSLSFQSIKNETKVETNGFATFSGRIDETGAAELRILLDSIDTKIDLRNVRMRFLFFETFKFPEAVVTVQLDPAKVADLPTLRRKKLRLPVTLNLHGVTRTFETDTVVTLLGDDLVSVASVEPVPVLAADYALSEGVEKLKEASGAVIIPVASFSYDLIFTRGGVAGSTQPLAKPASAALEVAGDFDAEACKGRFEILSRTGNIYFRPASSALDDESGPLLDTLVDIIGRCPGLMIEVSGHTDADGSDQTNQRLSEERARAVSQYLVAHGVEPGRITSVGFGESRPVAPNDTARNKARNRRIEFSVPGG